MVDLREQLQQLRELDDESLLRNLKRQLGSANRLNALVLAHLAEIDARGAYRKWACQTLADYCVYELRLSEDEAQRRCRAARVMRQFPVLFEMIADASTHLTGILLLAPYLTPDNHMGVLERARYRRKREIERLVAELAPARDVPALVQPLGVAMGTHTTPGKSWAALVESQLGWVRQLEPGAGPARAPSSTEAEHLELLRSLESEPQGETAVVEKPDTGDRTAPARPEGALSARPRNTDGDVPAPMRFKVQFTADQAYVDLLERARALLWHQLPGGELAELQRFALEALVEKLERRKCGARARRAAGFERTPVAAQTRAPSATSSAVTPDESSSAVTPDESSPRPSAASNDAASKTRTVGARGQRDGATGEKLAAPECGERDGATGEKLAAPECGERDGASGEKLAAPECGERDGAIGETFAMQECTVPDSVSHETVARLERSAPARQRSRHLSASVRREVWARDEGRCTFVDARGVRCRATRAIEFHHEQPHARGGPNTVENLSLRCRAHNHLAAERDFGRAFMQTAASRRSDAEI